MVAISPAELRALQRRRVGVGAPGQGSAIVTVDEQEGVTIVTLMIPAPARLLTTNAERRVHWSERAEIVRAWRWAAQIYARQARVPLFERAEVEFRISKRGRAADAGAHHPITKAVLDGLVDAGVLADDDPTHVVRIVELAPVRGDVDAVTVTLRGVRILCSGRRSPVTSSLVARDQEGVHEHGR